MKPEDILLALGEIDETLPPECTKALPQKASPWKGIVAAAACIAVVVFSVAIVRNLNKSSLPMAEVPSVQEGFAESDTLLPHIPQNEKSEPDTAAPSRFGSSDNAIETETPSVTTTFSTAPSSPVPFTAASTNASTGSPDFTGFTYHPSTTTHTDTSKSAKPTTTKRAAETTTATTAQTSSIPSGSNHSINIITPTTELTEQGTMFKRRIVNVLNSNSYTISDDMYRVVVNGDETRVFDVNTGEELIIHDQKTKDEFKNRLRDEILSIQDDYALTGSGSGGIISFSAGSDIVYSENYSNEWGEEIHLLYEGNGNTYVTSSDSSVLFSIEPGKKTEGDDSILYD